MKFLQFTDIHLTTPGNTIAGRDPNANFERALSHARANHPDAEALFITGDLSDWGERPDYERLRVIIDALDIPVYLCIGNHDERDTFVAVFPEHANADGFVQRSVKLSEATALTIDSWGPESHAGHLCERRAAWISEQLEQADAPVFLFIHHNIVPTGIRSTDKIMLQDTDLLARTLAPYRDKIAYIFHGHCHMNLSGTFHGIPFFAPRGTNHAGWPDFAEDSKLIGSDLNEAYAVITCAQGNTMIHPVEYGYTGPVRAEGAPEYHTWDRDAPR